MKVFTATPAPFKSTHLLTPLFLLLLATSQSVIAQEEAPFTDKPLDPPPLVTPANGSPLTAPQPPKTEDQQQEKAPFEDPVGPPDPSKQEQAPFDDPPPPKYERPLWDSDVRNPKPLAEFNTVELEIAEVKRLAAEELKRLRVRGQYATTLTSSRLSQVREENISILRESVAIAKNMVVGRRLSLTAFVQIQSECINAELAVAPTSSMRSSVLRKAIDACNYVEEKVKGIAGPASKISAPLFNPADIEAVTLQRENWEQLLNGGSTTTITSSSYPVLSIQSSAPSNVIYCRPTRRRR